MFTGNQLSRRGFLRMAGITGASAILSACALPTTPTAPTVAPGEAPTVKSGMNLLIMMRSDQAQDDLWRALIKPWEEETGNKVELFSATHLAGEGYEAKLQAFYAAGTPPDVINMDWGRMAEFRAKGAFLELNPLIEADQFDLEDFFPAGQRVYEEGNKVYGILRDIAPQVLFYNKKLLAETEMPTPTDEWKWADLLDAAIKLTKTTEEGVKIYGFGPYAGWVAISEFVVQNGGQLWDDLYNPTTLMINTPEGIEATQFWFDMLHVHKVIPTPADLQEVGWQPPLFAAGRLALCEVSLWYIDAWKKLDFEWDCVMMPYQKVRATHAFSAGYCIPSNPKDVGTSWSLLKHMCSKEVYKEIALGGWLMPGRRSIVAEYFVQSTPPENKVAFLKALEHETVYHIPLSPRANEVSDLINAELDPLMRAEKQPKEVIEALVPKVEALLASG